jgi:UDP-GlcNAc3NAcA epimerase
MNCIHVVGNRPQFIKLALLHQAIAKHTSFQQKIVHTGQHYDKMMSDIFFNELKIPPPDYQLKVNRLPHHAQIGRMTEKIGNILAAEKNNGVIIYGDTNTSLAGALAAKKNDLPIAHVEAGIRTGNEKMPEESNRYLVDRLSDINFCPTNLCKKNLEEEGVAGHKITVTGDIMLDAWKHAWDLINTGTPLARVPAHHYVLATIHREENNESAEKLAAIVEALNEIKKTIPVIMPCHPKTRKKIRELGIKAHFTLLSPCSYLQMIRLLDHSAYVITDSGGFCREAFFSGKPSLVIMDHPFWPEIIEQQQCLQTPAVRKTILDNFSRLQKVPIQYDQTIFGKGDAAKQMAAILAQEWSR